MSLPSLARGASGDFDCTSTGAYNWPAGSAASGLSGHIRQGLPRFWIAAGALTRGDFVLSETRIPLPPWLRIKVGKKHQGQRTRRVLAACGVHTVCQEARCPNIGECFGHDTATFMILGDVCTRDCGFCAVAHGKPGPLDPQEPDKVAEAAVELGLDYVVVTSVTRDDLPDGGAEHFAATIRALRDRLPGVGVEVLIPDFMGSVEALATVLEARPTVLNHNVETVARLQKTVRPQASYERSLRVLEHSRELAPSIPTKSGLMVGLGETDEEVYSTLKDLRLVGCDLVTIGQYLRPTRRHLPVERYVPPEQFAQYRRWAQELGFKHVAADPFVRSSYKAAEAAREALKS
ncbi:MAG: lipoyl synthase [Armatimonadetes bacterium]|nr:lipoyl synthase [Armatimonadota bacterium]